MVQCKKSPLLPLFSRRQAAAKLLVRYNLVFTQHKALFMACITITVFEKFPYGSFHNWSLHQVQLKW